METLQYKVHFMTYAITRPTRVLISGAAGGLGSSVARRFAADGAQVALTDINGDGVKALADELGGLPLTADGTVREELREVVARTAAEFGGIDAIIGAQGAQVTSTTSPKTHEGWQKSLDINLSGPFYLAAEAMPHLVASRGSAVLISSSAGIFSGPVGTAGYTAAKTGVVGLVRWLAREYGPQGVRVNGVSPGWIRTALGDGGMAFIAQRDGISVDEAYAAATSRVPLRRPADPAEIAAVCAFLTSSDASMVTGHTVVADGGGAVIDCSTGIFDPPAW
jgi:meso-butanediol dehydrogenase/(S,S)-butanediol dehydrogenase/diacetyl reductase